MTFNHFTRRLHLYLALGLIPWFLMYGASSLPFSHGKYFDGLYQDGVPLWKLRFDRPYEIDVPPGENLRPVGARILKDAGLEGSYGTYRQNEKQVNVYLYTFWKSTRLTYFVDEKRLLAEDRRLDRKSTRLNSSHIQKSRMPSSA